MRKSVWVLALLAILAAPIAALTAQTAPPAPYVVKPDDTGWALAREHYNDPFRWNLIVEMNPFLQEPGRVFEREDPQNPGEKQIILLLKPGERLFGLTNMGAEVDPVPIEEIAPQAPPAPVQAAETGGGMNWLLWLLLALAIFALAAGLVRNRRAIRVWCRRLAIEHELRRDPVTSGPAFVPGGIPPTEPDRLRQYFEQQAIAAYAMRNPHLERNAIRVEQVGPIEAVSLSGEGEVGYLGEDDWRPRRIDPPLDGYQGRYRFPDRTEQILQCLQGCMNPIRFGGEVLRGFTATVRRTVVPVPEPPRPAPQAVPHPAIAVRNVRTAAEAEGASTVLVGGRIMTVERGVHFDLDAAPGEIRMIGGAFEMTVKPRREKRARRATDVAAATGTTGEAE